ncbi:tape measure protein [Hyphomicrobium sp. D-2]|uniref:tape measure protein n=1 Tax=Hyphomicrobium sp. D-2 TaxID=3041621 RepID=UPI00245463CF|nr:tape measure protein [Hyphomicrobium sp. D-2]MDH4981245.1 tape measure protein [Hyphomicrobium sp. D-2]
MSVDIATLGIEVKSDKALTAKQRLEMLAETGRKLEGQMTRMVSGGDRLQSGHARMAVAAEAARRAAGSLSVQTSDAADKLRKMAQAASTLDGPLGGVASRIRSLGSLVRETSVGLALLATGAAAAVLAITRFGTQFADSWSDMSSRVGLAIGNMDAAAVVMDRLATVARRTYSALETTAESFVRNSTTLRELGKNTAQQLDFTEALNLALVVSGAKADRARMLQESLGRAMAGGALRGTELNSVIEQGGRVAEAIAEELGVGVNQLRAFGNQGKITSEVMYNAMTKRLMQFREEAEKMPATLGDGFTLLRNSFMRLIGTYDQSNKLSESVAMSFVAVADSLKTVARTAVVAASSIALVFASSIITGIYALSTAILVGAVGAMRALTVAVAANPLGALAVVIGTVISTLWQFSDRMVQVSGRTIHLGNTLDAVWTTITESVNIAITAITSLRDWLWKKLGLDGFASMAKSVFSGIAESATNLATSVWGFIKRNWSAAADIAESGAASLKQYMSELDADTKKAADSIVASVTKIGKAWDKINVTRLAFAANMPSSVVMPEKEKTSPPPAVADMSAYDKAIEQTQKRIEGMRIEAASYDMAGGAAARYRTVMELTNLATSEGIVLNESQIAQIQRLGSDVESLTAHLDGLQVMAENLTPFEAYGKELERLDYLVQKNALSMEDYEKAATRAAENAGIAWHQTADTITGAIVAVAKSSGESNKTMSKIAQAAGIAQAIVNTHVGITKALASSAPPWNFALAAAVAAQGFASVAAIRSQSTSIGSISTPSVSSASSAPAQIPTATNDKPTQPATTIVINGERFGYKEIEELVERLSEHGRDGGRIVVQRGSDW